jgi:hypothetical protein
MSVRPDATEPLDDVAAGRLHELRVRGYTDVEHPAADQVLLDAELVRRRGQFWMLTPTGAELASSHALLPDGDPRRIVVQGAYEAFLPINTELLRVCTAWQLRPTGEANDHSDPKYDSRVCADLKRVHRQVTALLATLRDADRRFTVYEPRLAHAIRQLDEGRADWFTSPRIDSYHTVWMHIHEELLLALGTDRSTETPP